jgi:polyribonucleotide nucleotidyltransferase
MFNIIEKESNLNNFKYHSCKVLINNENIIFESGKLAKKANGSILTTWGKSVVLTTVCMTEIINSDIDFFPLTCEYIEKAYAFGKIPGGFFKREGRPKDLDIMKSRIIDRSIRPLFPKDFKHNIHLVSTVFSHDGSHDTDTMAMCGSFMALHVSDIPFAEKIGAIGGVRVIKKNEKLVINPHMDDYLNAKMNLFVVFSKDKILMIDGYANEISESELLDALFFSKANGFEIISASEEMKKEISKNKIKWMEKVDDKIKSSIKNQFNDIEILNILKTTNKNLRDSKFKNFYKKIMLYFKDLMNEDYLSFKKDIESKFMDIKNEIIRKYIIQNNIRLDGRKITEIRKISSNISVLPMAHGSSLFSRGDTQVLVSCTLGTFEDRQKVDDFWKESKSRFMLHYNFPSFSVGETRISRSVSRREVGHGLLALKSINYLLPPENKLPYTIRIVSEVLESNGSSSMATVCGTSLALFDAGINAKKLVAGISIGLISDSQKNIILSDITGEEDFFGDMDFKICGTEDGITAIQVDLKINGISKEIIREALIRAKDGRIFILKEMKKIISKPRKSFSENAPRIFSLKVNPNKIKDIIGPGGRMIKGISSKTNTRIDILDDKIVQISSTKESDALMAKKIIEQITKEAKINHIYNGYVKKITNYGAFIEIFKGTEGLCHISEISKNRINNIKDVLIEGDKVKVVVLSIDKSGKIKLSIKKAVDFEIGSNIPH